MTPTLVEFKGKGSPLGWLLNLVYAVLIAGTSPYLLYCALRYGKYREGWSEKLWGLVPPRVSRNRCLWLHAVSVGEVNLLQPLIARLEAEYPESEIVISVTTQAGYALAKKRYAPRTVFYAPLDFTWATAIALDRIRPALLVLVELEVWPNLIEAAHRRRIPIAVVNGRLSERSFRGYSRLAFAVRRVFSRIDCTLAQTDEYAERFRNLGCRSETVHVTGSLKFDGARHDRLDPAVMRLAKLAGITANDRVLLAGSTQAGEEEVALQSFLACRERDERLKLILVPRHPERFEEVAELLRRSGVPFARRSKLSEEHPAAERIVLVDAVGELGAWWGTAHIAFVGGSLGNRGGQNMIEPAAFGAAVCFGPNTWNFRDVVLRMLAENAAVEVKNGEELRDFVSRCLQSPEYANQLGEAAQKLVRSQQGATDRTLALLRPFLIDPESSPNPTLSGPHRRAMDTRRWAV